MWIAEKAIFEGLINVATDVAIAEVSGEDFSAGDAASSFVQGAAGSLLPGGNAANAARKGAKAGEVAKNANRASDAAKNADGVIYKVPGQGTKSGRPYIGRSKNLKQRTAKARDGRDRSTAEVVDRYDANNVHQGRVKEQQHINREGGVPNLDNKRNEISPLKWPEPHDDPSWSGL